LYRPFPPQWEKWVPCLFWSKKKNMVKFSPCLITH
jgi:hypothetical protein